MNALVQKFAQYSAWRKDVVRTVSDWRDWAREAHLSDLQSEGRISRVLSQLGDDKLTVAFVAEFSRGKSELINAIFFADYGQRILPSSAGRTTMCPTELLYDENLPPAIRLLPIETRAYHATTAEYKALPQEWHVLPLDTTSGTSMLAAFAEVSKVKRVPVEEARRYGLYDETDKDQLGGVDAEGKVEISMWRHAVINFPHPLLRQGLVILDTPGLNAIGSEPELTLSMIPSAHAVLFVLAADTGVTKSDIEVWRSHIGGGRKQGRMVVLNKIDSMWDDLKSPAQIDADIERQVKSCAQLLDLDVGKVFPVSAQKGLVAKVNPDAALLERSRLPALERALSLELIPQKQEIVRELVHRELFDMIGVGEATLAARSASLSDQLAELNALRGKNANVIAHMVARVRSEKEEFDKSLLAFQALRAVYARLSKEVFTDLGLIALRERTRAAREQMEQAAFSLGIREAMTGYFGYVRESLASSQTRVDEIGRLMTIMYQKFATEHGMRLKEPMKLSLARYANEIKRIEQAYQDRFGLLTIVTTEKLVLTQKFFESIASRVKATYEIANRDVEAWLKAIMAPLEGQIREHQGQLRRRLDSIRHVQEASESLDERIAEVVQQDAESKLQLRRLENLRASVEHLLEPEREPVPAEKVALAG